MSSLAKRTVTGRSVMLRRLVPVTLSVPSCATVKVMLAARRYPAGAAVSIRVYCAPTVSLAVKEKAAVGEPGQAVDKDIGQAGILAAQVNRGFMGGNVVKRFGLVKTDIPGNTDVTAIVGAAAGGKP